MRFYNDHIERIVEAYHDFQDEPGFTRVATLEEIRAKDGNLSIPLYVESSPINGILAVGEEPSSLAETLEAWLKSRADAVEALTQVLPEETFPTPNISMRGNDICDLLKGKANWKRVRFGDVVENVNETERNPTAVGIERYIGLEHLEPGSLHIRAWGNVADGTTFTRRCRPGQVLFGKRRAYQRKVAVAEFDAVVSGDIYVLAPKNDRLLPELLPFLCLTERFFQHAVDTSAGSLSPRTNWNSLASFEFDLPPLDQQRRIAEILWAVDKVECAWAQNQQVFHALFAAQLLEEFEKISSVWPSRALENVACVERGKFSHRPRNLPDFYGGQFPFVQTGDVQNAVRILEMFENKLTELGATYSKSFPAGTIFVTIAAVIGATAISDRQVFVTDSVVGVVPNEDMDVDFLELFLRSKRNFLENQAATQTAQKNINLQVLRPLLVPYPPKSAQKEIAVKILASFYAEQQVQTHIENLRSLLFSLINLIAGAKP